MTIELATLADMMVVAQATELSCYKGGDMYSCMLDDIRRAFGGEAVFGFMVAGAFMLSLYIASDFDPAAPTVGTILMGGLLVPALPASYRWLGVTMIVLGAVIGVFVASKRYVLQVGT